MVKRCVASIRRPRRICPSCSNVCRQQNIFQLLVAVITFACLVYVLEYLYLFHGGTSLVTRTKSLQHSVLLMLGYETDQNDSRNYTALLVTARWSQELNVSENENFYRNISAAPPPRSNRGQEHELPSCPMPYLGSECRIAMAGRLSNGSMTHSGVMKVNNKTILHWERQEGLYLARLNYKCGFHSWEKIDSRNETKLLEYFTKVPLGTVLLAMSGDHRLMSSQLVSNVLKMLGMDLNMILVHHMHGGVVKVGYRGVSRWEHRSYIMGPLVWQHTFIIGRTFPLSLSAVSEAELLAAHKEMRSGGHWGPLTCQSQWKVAIVVPFRDRDLHLRIWLANILKFLQRQNIQFTIFVIEQAPPQLFNRAALMNIGFVEAEKTGQYDCFIFHDVDLIPEDICNLYACSAFPRHIAIAMNKYEYTLPYDSYVGGVFSLLPDHMREINGFSNVMFGWGGEDDDIWSRLAQKNLMLMRFPPEVSTYVMLSHDNDVTNPRSGRSMELVSKHSAYMAMDGLNSLNYETLDVDKKQLYTKIKVKLEGPVSELGIQYFYDNAVRGFIHRLYSTGPKTDNSSLPNNITISTA